MGHLRGPGFRCRLFQSCHWLPEAATPDAVPISTLPGRSEGRGPSSSIEGLPLVVMRCESIGTESREHARLNPNAESAGPC